MLGAASTASTRFATAQTAETAETAGQRTPEQILGPFYPLKKLGQNADLTKVPGRPGGAAGLVLNVIGQVLNLKGEPVRNDRMRPAHIHFQVSARQDRLVTQMYFEGDPYLQSDRFFQTALEQKDLLVAKLLQPTSEMDPGSKLDVFNIVLNEG